MALPVVSALLLTAAFPPFNLSYLAWFALVPMGWAMTRKSCVAELYIGAFVGGLVFHLAALDWMRTSYGGSGLSGGRAMSWFVSALVAAFTWQLALLLGRRLRWRTNWPVALCLPLVWVASEFVRKYLYLLPAESTFPWLQLGTTQVGSNPSDAGGGYVVQVADIGGVWAVTAVVAMVNGFWIDLVEAISRRRERPQVVRRFVATAALCATTLVACFAYGGWRLSQDGILQGPVVCLMPPEVAIDYGDETRGPTLLAGHTSRIEPVSSRTSTSEQPEIPETTPRPQLLLWSEMAFATRLGAGVQMNDESEGFDTATRLASRHSAGTPLSGDLSVPALEAFAEKTGATLALGCGRYDRGGDSEDAEYNSVAIVDPARGFVGFYDKLCLVPFIEFTPSPKVPFIAPSVRTFERGTAHPVFDLPSSDDSAASQFAATICYDTCFPNPHRQFMNRSIESQPDFFVASSCETADQTLALQQSIFALARFRAIECRRAVVRNVENGYSGLIDGSGRVIASPDELTIKEPYTLPPVPIDRRMSLYVLLGDWLPISACLVVTAGVLLPRRRVRNESGQNFT